MAEDIGYYALPVIASFEGVDKQVNSKLGKSLGDMGVKGGRNLAKGIADGVKAGEGDVKRALDGYSKLYDKQADAAGKLRTELAKLDSVQKTGNQARIIAQSERVEKARRDEARAVRDARDAYQDYESAAKQAASAGDKVGGGLLDKLKGAAGGAKSSGSEAATGFVEGFGGPIAALGTKAGPIGLALAAAAAVGLAAGGLIGKQVMAGLEQEAQRDVVQAQLGLDDASMRRVADSAGKAYGENFGSSVQENMDTARVALQSGLLSGADDPNSKVVIERLNTVSQILGEDIPRVARSASQLVRTGMAKDFEQAFDLIVRGGQNGLNVSEDLLDTVNEYSTQWRKLGLSGPEAMGLLSQAVKGGARDTDVAADSLKEFSIRVVDGSKTTTDAFSSLGLNADDMQRRFLAGGQSAHDAMRDVFDAVQRVQDPVVKSNALLGLFGTQFEDMGSALQAFDLTNAVNQFGQVDGAAQKAADTVGNNAVSSIESAKRAFETGSASMQQSLADAFGPSLKEGADFLVAHQGEISHAFNFMAGGAVEFGAAVTGVVGSVIWATGQIVGAIGDTAGFVLDGFEQMAHGAAIVADAVGADGLANDLNHAADQMGVFSDQFHGWGEGLKTSGTDVMNFGLHLHELDTSLGTTQQGAANAAAQIEHVTGAMQNLPGGKQIDINAIVRLTDQNGNAISPDQLIAPGFIPAVPGETRRPRGGGRARGGVLPGYSPGVDNLLVPMSGGEGVLIPQATRALGGAPFINGINKMFAGGYADGGVVGPDVLAAAAMVGTGYSQDKRNDCSGMVARVINQALGMPTSGLMSTKTATEWLKARGFKPGLGGPGQISVGWYDHGPNPNDGHMAMTLSDGRNAESGGSHGDFIIGAGAAGADDPQFDQHMFLPTVYGEGKAGSSGSVSALGASSASSGAGGNVVDQGAVADANARVAEADARVRESEAKQRELKADAKESDKISAQADVDKAKADAEKARRDLAEAQAGKPAAGGKGAGKGGGGGQNPLKEILGIVGGGLKETFGIGEWLPDIADLMPVKMAESILSTAMPMLAAYQSGEWQPGGLLGQALGTSGAPFGMSDVAVPPPPGTAASGIGSGPAPGPGTTVNIDQSIQGNVGWDPEKTMKHRDEGLKRAIPRIPAGS